MFYGVSKLTQCHPHPGTESTDSSTTKKQKHVVKVAREALKITFLLVGYITKPNNKEHAWK